MEKGRYGVCISIIHLNKTFVRAQNLQVSTILRPPNKIRIPITSINRFLNDYILRSLTSFLLLVSFRFYLFVLSAANAHSILAFFIRKTLHGRMIKCFWVGKETHTLQTNKAKRQFSVLLL